MPRKKSATKIAKEKQEAEIAKRIAENEASENPLPLDIEELKKELREAEEGESEESEEEDDYGELLTEDVESGLNEVLKAIKTGDQRLFDSNVKFFNDDAQVTTKDKESKPIYLKDYQREALLAGKEEFDSVDGDKPYTQLQKEDKENLIREIHNQLGDDEDDEDNDDDFLIKKDPKPEAREKQAKKVELPNPEEVGGEKFLEAFMENHAWLPNKGTEVTMDNEDDDEFDEAAETFENAYNHRYEDPNANEIISYARSQATMRREKMNSRKRERLRKQEEMQKEKQEINEQLKKKKQKKANLVADRMKEIKEAVGDQVSEEKIIKVFGESLMNEDFNDEEWDSKMAQIFDDEYYENEDNNIAKPEWDDDVMGEIGNDLNVSKEGDDEEEEEEGDDEEEEEEGEEEEDDEFGKEKGGKPSKRQKKEEKYNKKQEKNKIKELAERLVESKTLDILDEVQEERGAGKGKSEYTFKYREVSPESFGLTYNEIFKADDKSLNEFIGLKKLAPYRPQEKVVKDKRKVTKSKHIKEWRKKTFGDEKGVSEDADLDIKIPSIVFDVNTTRGEGPKRKKRKTSKRRKGL